MPPTSRARGRHRRRRAPSPRNATPMPSFAARRSRVDGIPVERLAPRRRCVCGRAINSGTIAAAAAASAGRDARVALARGARGVPPSRRARLFFARRRRTWRAAARGRVGLSRPPRRGVRASERRFVGRVGRDSHAGEVAAKDSRQTASVTVYARSRPEPANVPDSTRSRTSGVSFAEGSAREGGSRRSRRGGAGGDARSGRELVEVVDAVDVSSYQVDADVLERRHGLRIARIPLVHRPARA